MVLHSFFFNVINHIFVIQMKLSTRTTSTTSGTLEGWGAIRIEEVLPRLCWVVIPRDKILDNSQAGKLSAPSPPFTDPSNRPPTLRGQVLAPTTAK